MGNKVYTEDSIQSLTPLEFTRLRPGVYCGSTEYSTQLLIEIVSNAIDEFKAGHGDTIKVDITKDNVIIVEDILYYDGGYLDATNLTIAYDEESCESYLKDV